jgi:hypothetical protein
MRNMFFLVLVLAGLILAGWWAHEHFSPHSNAYAPKDADDTELTAQPVPDQPASARQPPMPASAKAPDPTLPSAPVPYDQLQKGDQPPADPDAAPKDKSNDKAVFY